MKILLLTLPILLLTACVHTENNKKSIVENQTHREHLCTSDYRPICANVEIHCVTVPCEPIQQTFSNPCVMGNNPHATFLHEGVCKK